MMVAATEVSSIMDAGNSSAPGLDPCCDRVMNRAGTLMAVGIVCLDIVNTVAEFPAEDTAVRAIDSTRCRGGNAANLASVFSELDQTEPNVAFVGSISDATCDPAAAFVTEDLSNRGVLVDGMETFEGSEYCLPTSYVTLSQSAGTRSIVHRRVLPELTMDGFVQALRKQPDPAWIHFEGRNVEVVVDMMSHARLHANNVIISVEIEKVSLEMPERLTRLADYCIFSKEFVQSRDEGAQNPEKFMTCQYEEGLVDTYAASIICPWGDKGAYAMSAHDRCLVHATAWKPDAVVDSLGAGDTFISASIFALLRLQIGLGSAMAFACEVAGRKCGQAGLEMDAMRESMKSFDGGAFWQRRAGRWEKHQGSSQSAAASCSLQ